MDLQKLITFSTDFQSVKKQQFFCVQHLLKILCRAEGLPVASCLLPVMVLKMSRKQVAENDDQRASPASFTRELRCSPLPKNTHRQPETGNWQPRREPAIPLTPELRAGQTLQSRQRKPATGNRQLFCGRMV
jgi:hypothetical protein